MAEAAAEAAGAEPAEAMEAMEAMETAMEKAMETAMEAAMETPQTLRRTRQTLEEPVCSLQATMLTTTTRKKAHLMGRLSRNRHHQPLAAATLRAAQDAAQSLRAHCIPQWHVHGSRPPRRSLREASLLDRNLRASRST